VNDKVWWTSANSQPAETARKRTEKLGDGDWEVCWFALKEVTDKEELKLLKQLHLGEAAPNSQVFFIPPRHPGNFQELYKFS